MTEEFDYDLTPDPVGSIEGVTDAHFATAADEPVPRLPA